MRGRFGNKFEARCCVACEQDRLLSYRKCSLVPIFHVREQFFFFLKGCTALDASSTQSPRQEKYIIRDCYKRSRANLAFPSTALLSDDNNGFGGTCHPHSAFTHTAKSEHEKLVSLYMCVYPSTRRRDLTWHVARIRLTHIIYPFRAPPDNITVPYTHIYIPSRRLSRLMPTDRQHP
jgi:hypothetical protein